MEGTLLQQFSGQTLLVNNAALAGALKRIRGKGFSLPEQIVKSSNSYDDFPYGDEYADAYPDYVDTTYGNSKELALAQSVNFSDNYGDNSSYTDEYEDTREEDF